ncbi:NAD-dependent epimerase/dehydratase family protein [Oceaniovalibus sp. ACAM 378]|uniref:NAD-dependent epimerase/dehydratase family protein n=1 Tax=Oceaniovalibus sp. ACAM 378 TaxID=2599923 RepID=UPI0011D6B01F|nr:NAD-dependent epimerase/dehydratase family protein [Oceaniovalibus sp. ACAM 378]TYB90131.1 NAD-dependent epimerase/dehydratase family protein [Oceaniovalibus sp. ACAM 378]
MNSPVFLGSGARVARLVAKRWPNFDTGGDFPLRVARRPGRDCDILWDMTAPPPSLEVGHSVAVCFAGATPRGDGPLDTNTTLALAALSAARRWRLKHLFLCSSSAVYGDPGPDTVPEVELPAPGAPYGRAKLAMEQAVRADIRVGDPGVTILRLANVAGAGEPFDSAQKRDLPALPLHQFADGLGPSRSYISPRDLARVLHRLCYLANEAARLPFLLNVAAPQPTAMADILTALNRRWIWTQAPANAIQCVHLDTARLAALCHLHPDSGSAARMVADLSGTEAPT